MDPAKLHTMSKWPISIKDNKVQVFLGFANDHCQFIDNYSAKTCRLLNLRTAIPFTLRYTQ